MAKVLFDADSVSRMIARISHEIIERNNGAEGIVLAGILRRGVPIAQRISEKIEQITGVAIPVGELDITLYRDDLGDGRGAPEAKARSIGIDAAGKTVVLVDDVIFTGRTVRAAIDALFDESRPRCVQLVSLVDRGHRELPIRPDYVGKNIPTSLSETISVCTEGYDGEWKIEIDSK